MDWHTKLVSRLIRSCQLLLLSGYLSLSFSVVLSTDRYQLVAAAAADAAVVGLFLQFKCHVAASAHMLPQRGKS